MVSNNFNVGRTARYPSHFNDRIWFQVLIIAFSFPTRRLANKTKLGRTMRQHRKRKIIGTHGQSAILIS